MGDNWTSPAKLDVPDTMRILLHRGCQSSCAELKHLLEFSKDILQR